MELVKDTFNERVREIESYFDLVSNIESAIGQGSARFDVNGQPYQITPIQQKVMYSVIYLQLYNLVEATMNLLIEAVERNTRESIDGDVSLLSENLRNLYVKFVTQPEDDSSGYEAKLKRALCLFKQILRIEPADIGFPAGGGGNWNYTEIRSYSLSLGVEINLPPRVNTMVQRRIRNNEPPLQLIKRYRNDLAHGAISFEACGEGHVASDFRYLIDVVKLYLTHVIDAYELFITEQRFRSPVA
ncbi:MAE_28990/MAE_18760 family HEPN-like nuclease [Aeromonas veronii]|uniref:MAE_28990/MAE_18760 family HEPN-like nuclease n=1 Tax=Aeromonas veronii TaxID=654 RepID=UPI0038D28317